MKRIVFVLVMAGAGVVAWMLSGVGAGAQGVKLVVKADQVTAKVSPRLYGLMTEEINYSYDGGLYGELVRDRAIGGDWDALEHWTSVTTGDAVVRVTVDEKTGPSKALPRSMKVEVSGLGAALRAGVQNDGYWGIAVSPETRYEGSFYAHGDVRDVTVSLVNDETGESAASTTVTGVGGEWQRYDFVLKTGKVETTAKNHLQLTMSYPSKQVRLPRAPAGTMWFDLISLFPPTYKGREQGNRVDLMEKLAAMHPKFLRFPGGNYVEGNHIAERFNWKETIGPWVERPTHKGPWGYRSSDGMGLLEFLEWCEDLKMEPVLAVYAGYSLAGEHVDAGEKLEPFVQDALDEIEYVTGSADSRWGAERVKDGHAAAFDLRYVEIGNEDEFDRSGSYEGRYAQFYKAIKARYPELQLIATTEVKGVTPDVLDEHFYMAADKALSDAGHYDKAPRTGPKIFVGEWATREGSPTPNLRAALGDAAWMTGMERNSDLVIMASYAPLLVNVNPGGMQWETDLIGYDALVSYGSPSYWAQVMFGSYVGSEVVSAKLSGGGPYLFTSSTRDEKKRKIFVKIVNASSEMVPLEMEIDGVGSLKAEAKLITLSGRTPNVTNSLAKPDAVVPVEKKVRVGREFEQKIEAYSINVLEINY